MLCSTFQPCPCRQAPERVHLILCVRKCLCVGRPGLAGHAATPVLLSACCLGSVVPASEQGPCCSIRAAWTCPAGKPVELLAEFDAALLTGALQCLL